LLGAGKILLGEGITTAIWSLIFSRGLDQILLGDWICESVTWGCDFLDHIYLGWPTLTSFLLGVLLGVDLLGVVR
jgi:hypothetical protein